mmetsp:Transcript_54578/g.111376  ORF Transcript_54578/g.111376 Transcript_54578/m.111376 type:complete len:406 (-) Transcript_54578:763-1980(-)
MLQLHWRREPAQHGENRRLADVFERERLRFLPQLEHLLWRELRAVLGEQPEAHGDVVRLLGRLPGGGLPGLRERHRQLLGCFVITACNCHRRGACLRVPALELREINAVGIGHGRTEVVARDSLAVVALKVQVHPLAEPLLAEEGLVHANHLGSLVVHRGSIEVVHGNIALRANRVCHRARVLGELGGAQHAHVLDTLDGLRRHVHRELLVPEHREAFLEGELEPVPARDAIACPVVEVFVCNHTLDALEVGVRGGGGGREDARCVEYVEALVLHRAHVEVAHRHDVVHVQVVLQPKRVLVPLHRLLQALHSTVELVDVAVLRENLQLYLPPRHGGVRVLDRTEVPCDEGKEIRGLHEGVFPLRIVLTPVHVPLLDEIPVGEEDGVLLLVCLNPHLVLGHAVGAV